MSNIREVSRVAGVSTATVSRALSTPDKVSEKTLKKVYDAVEKVQYRPNMMAQNFRATRAWSLMVLVPDITNRFFATVIQGIEDTAQKNGYSVLLGDTRDSEQREAEYIRRVETRQSDGIIQLRPHHKGDPKPAEHLKIVNACGCEGTPYDCVRIDNVGASRAIVDHLIDMGHRRIGVISGLADNPHSIDRLKGYHQSLAAAGIAPDSSLITHGDFTLWSGLQAAGHFTRMPARHRPTAIFSMNDDMAIGALQGLKNASLRVPDDISIAGFDDTEYARFSDPALTTIAQPGYDLGRCAADRVLRLIEGDEDATADIVLPHELILRQSTGAHRK